MTGEMGLPVWPATVQFPDMATRWRPGPTQALPEVPGKGFSVGSGLVWVPAVLANSGMRPQKGLWVLSFSAAAGNQMKFASTGVCGALATDQALGLGKPRAYTTKPVRVPEEPTVHVCGAGRGGEEQMGTPLLPLK